MALPVWLVLIVNDASIHGLGMDCAHGLNEEGRPFGEQETSSWENVRTWLVQSQLIPDSVKAEDAFIHLQGEEGEKVAGMK